MRIAIIGSGISGLMCARLLHRQHEITVFESNNYVGGHVNTVRIESGDQVHEVDTGFIVFNDQTYPNFRRLLDRLGVATDPTQMSFSVRCDRSGLEYNGTNLNGLFAQRANLVRPSFLRMLAEILRFNRTGTALRGSMDESMTVGEFAARYGYHRRFIEDYLLPMGAAIWSCPPGVFADFPIRFIIDFYHNHGLLRLRNRPTWRVIRGGSARYVQALIQPFRNRIRLRCPVRRVARHDDGVFVEHGDNSESFDEVIMACHSDQALRLLATPSSTEQRVLRAFPYSTSAAVLHTDVSVLPTSRRAWAAWNYHIGDDDQAATVTYNMNLLQHIQSPETFLVTLNESKRIDPTRQIARFTYSHPVFTTQRSVMQSRHDQLIRNSRVSFCGAWWGAGFHEDGVNSALAVCRRFGVNGWENELAVGIDRIDRGSALPLRDHEAV